jgi:hypothetical protein
VDGIHRNPDLGVDAILYKLLHVGDGLLIKEVKVETFSDSM